MADTSNDVIDFRLELVSDLNSTLSSVATTTVVNMKRDATKRGVIAGTKFYLAGWFPTRVETFADRAQDMIDGLEPITLSV